MALRSYMYGDPANCVEAVRAKDEKAKRVRECGTCANWITAWDLATCERGLRPSRHCYQWVAKERK